YIKAMKEKIAVLETTRTVEGLQDLADAFKRIAEADKPQWQPYYYAALAQVNSGYAMMDNPRPDKIDPVADKAEALLNKAEALSKNNSEIYAVKSMIATLRYIVNPMKRAMKYAPLAAQALETAKKLNPENPRVYLLKGRDKFHTPTLFGGSKAEAKKLFELSLQKFEFYKPATALDPYWGRGTANHFLSQIK
ncbi:MAG: hypothetical protein M3352_04320, partial [Bacteroidota bacterium]|nr:hypothetical protein [Bacteroidota bacterium]